jgi:hypothetical protein
MLILHANMFGTAIGALPSFCVVQLAGQRQASGTDLAARMAESSSQTTETQAAVAQ